LGAGVRLERLEQPRRRAGQVTRSTVLVTGLTICAFLVLLYLVGYLVAGWLTADGVVQLIASAAGAAGFICAAIAVRSPTPEPSRLRIACWSLATWLALSVLAGFVAMIQDPLDISRTGYIVRALVVAAALPLAGACVISALAFRRVEGSRYRLLSWVGPCVCAYYFLLLPSALRNSFGHLTLGPFWPLPLRIARIFFGVAAGILAYLAFAPLARSVEHQTPSGFQRRDQRLCAAATLLLLFGVLDLALGHWSFSEPAQSGWRLALAGGAVEISAKLLFPAFFLLSSLAFFVSGRNRASAAVQPGGASKRSSTVQ
jgi:hypothetical protein